MDHKDDQPRYRGALLPPGVEQHLVWAADTLKHVTSVDAYALGFMSGIVKDLLSGWTPTTDRLERAYALASPEGVTELPEYRSAGGAS